MKESISLLLFFLTLAFIPPAAFAQNDNELETLQMYYKEEDINVVSATRFAKLMSRTAENITVITAKDIEEMNAHTLGDVLDRIPGVQTDWGAWIGAPRAVSIQGAEYKYVKLQIDGVSINNLSDNISEVGAIPVQNIERIEIIKGPVSFAWGSSLGGVINLITKDASVKKISGVISASYGEMNTGDFRAEISGRKDNFTYYLLGGRLGSHGMNPGTRDSANNLYAKFSYAISTKLNLSFTTGYNKAIRGLGDYIDYDFKTLDNYEMLFSTLNADYAINQDAALSLSLRKSWYTEKIFDYAISTGENLNSRIANETNTGGSLNFSWKHSMHSIVLGADIDQGRGSADYYINTGQLALNKTAVYANDTFSIGKFTITPGIRYDSVNTAGSFTSPSIGIVYKATDRTGLEEVTVIRCL